jgi:large subunit ribosomal protein L4
MEAKVLNKEGKETGRKVVLNDAVFALAEPNDHAIYLDVRQIMANGRQGTHKAKERGEVRGSTKKPFRQKGTGGARSGHKRSPLWRHGGRVFGPRPRDYGFSLNKKTKVLARVSALTYKAREEKLVFVENFSFDKPKTKDFLTVMNNLSPGSRKVLFLLAGASTNFYLSGRNVPGMTISLASDLNTYDILNADRIVIVEEALKVIETNLIG